MKISKKSQYGLRSLVYLSKQPDKYFSLRLISQQEKIPFNYLEKILSELERNNLVKSKKGAYGGYALARKPSQITVGQVIKILEKGINLVECIGSNNCAMQKTCTTINFWKKLQESLEKTIDSITLKDLIK